MTAMKRNLILGDHKKISVLLENGCPIDIDYLFNV
jgi:hypothetical protein